MQPPQDRRHHPAVDHSDAIGTVSAQNLQSIRAALSRLLGEDEAEQYALERPGTPGDRRTRNRRIFDAARLFARRRPPE